VHLFDLEIVLQDALQIFLGDFEVLEVGGCGEWNWVSHELLYFAGIWSPVFSVKSSRPNRDGQKDAKH